MNTLMIRVAHKGSEIQYEQSVRESLSFSATCTEGWSKANNPTALMKTIKEMCAEVKSLHHVTEELTND